MGLGKALLAVTWQGLKRRNSTCCHTLVSHGAAESAQDAVFVDSRPAMAMVSGTMPRVYSRNNCIYETWCPHASVPLDIDDEEFDRNYFVRLVSENQSRRPGRNTSLVVYGGREEGFVWSPYVGSNGAWTSNERFDDGGYGSMFRSTVDSSTPPSAGCLRLLDRDLYELDPPVVGLVDVHQLVD